MIDKQYIFSVWHHHSVDYPEWIFSEVNIESNVLRQIEYFRGGKYMAKTAEGLGFPSVVEKPFPDFPIDDNEGEFTTVLSNSESFDNLWKKAISSAA